MTNFDADLHNPVATAQERQALISRPVYLDGDSYMWIIHAKEARGSGVSRLRYTYADNAPFGREMHWSQSIIWFSRLMAQFFPQPEPDLRLEWAATWVNTVLQIVFVTTASVLVWRSIGPWPAAFTPFLLIGMSDLNAAFHPFRPDHQTLYCLFSMLAVMFPLCGLNRQPSASPSRYPANAAWFAAGGCAMGLLFWVGSIVAVIVLTLLTVAWIAMVLLMRRENLADAKSGWRVFGIAAGSVSLLMYLTEYAPYHMGWRLEVNHPLYSLALAAHGELLHRFGRWWCGDFKLHQEGLSSAGLVALLLLPLTVAATAGNSVFVLHDDATRRMMRFITEYQPYFAGASLEQITGTLFRSHAMIPVVAVLALALGVATRNHVSAIWLGLLSLFFWLITLCQMRWADLASLFAVLAVAAGFGALNRHFRSGRAFTILAAIGAVLALQAYALLFYRYSAPRDMVRGAGIDQRLIKFFLEKRFALDFGQALSADDRRPVMVIPDLAPALKFFTGIGGVGSSYWPNVEGVEDTVRFFNDQSAGADEAQDVARKRELEWVILPPAPPLAEHFWIIEHGEMNPKLVRQTLLSRILNRPEDAPEWLARDRMLGEMANPPYSLGPHTLRNTYQVWRLDVDR